MLRLDHIVIAVRDLEQAAAGYRALGFTVQPGGRHPTRTTHNALVAFADGAYIELIAWLGPMPSDRWYDTHRQHGDGMMDFALLPEDTARTIAEAKARGVTLNGPLDGGRLRPDGQELKWQTARPTSFDLPFLCGDLTPRTLRVPSGDAWRHANGATGVASVAVAVHDVDASLARYRALLGVSDEGHPEATITAPFVLPRAGVRMAAVALRGTTIALVSPSPPAARGGASFANDLAARLGSRGEGPHAIAIATSSREPAGLLDPAQAQGAWIELVAAGRATAAGC